MSEVNAIAPDIDPVTSHTDGGKPTSTQVIIDRSKRGTWRDSGYIPNIERRGVIRHTSYTGPSRTRAIVLSKGHVRWGSHNDFGAKKLRTQINMGSKDSYDKTPRETLYRDSERSKFFSIFVASRRPPAKGRLYSNLVLGPVTVTEKYCET